MESAKSRNEQPKAKAAAKAVASGQRRGAGQAAAKAAAGGQQPAAAQSAAPTRQGSRPDASLAVGPQPVKAAAKTAAKAKAGSKSVVVAAATDENNIARLSEPAPRHPWPPGYAPTKPVSSFVPAHGSAKAASSAPKAARSTGRVLLGATPAPPKAQQSAQKIAAGAGTTSSTGSFHPPARKRAAQPLPDAARKGLDERARLADDLRTKLKRSLRAAMAEGKLREALVAVSAEFASWAEDVPPTESEDAPPTELESEDLPPTTPLEQFSPLPPPQRRAAVPLSHPALMAAYEEFTSRALDTDSECEDSPPAGPQSSSPAPERGSAVPPSQRSDAPADRLEQRRRSIHINCADRDDEWGEIQVVERCSWVQRVEAPHPKVSDAARSLARDVLVSFEVKCPGGPEDLADFDGRLLDGLLAILSEAGFELESLDGLQSDLLLVDSAGSRCFDRDALRAADAVNMAFPLLGSLTVLSLRPGDSVEVLPEGGCQEWVHATVQHVDGDTVVVKVEAGQEEREEAVPRLSGRLAVPIADHLLNQGVTLRQLLEFYHEYTRRGAIRADTTTEDVVSKIIIPETHDPPRCYMKSDFMQNLGGGQRSQRMVSHAWRSSFVGTVLNVLMDASGWTSDYILSGSGSNGREPIFKDGRLDTDRVLEELPEGMQETTYWMCAFALNEHRMICGDCSCRDCSMTEPWQADPRRHLAVDPCMVCAAPKRIPCACGCEKYDPEHRFFEGEAYEAIISKVDALVVSLDPDLDSVKRLWVMAEMGVASQSVPVIFRDALGLTEESRQKLRSGTALLPPIDKGGCSDEDRVWILNSIRKIDGGIEAYDELINCLLELHFGRCTRLSLLKGFGEEVMCSITQLEMDFGWLGDVKAITPALVGDDSCWMKLRSLRFLGLTLGGEALEDVDALAIGLQQARELRTLHISFPGPRLQAGPLFHALASLPHLTELHLNLSVSKVQDTALLCQGLGRLKQLRVLRLDLRQTEVQDLRPLSQELSGMKQLRDLFLYLSNAKVQDMAPLGEALGRLRRLYELHLDLSWTEVQDVAPLGDSLRQLKHLRGLHLYLSQTKVQDLAPLGEGIAKLQLLQRLKVDLDHTHVQDVAPLGEALCCTEQVSKLHLDMLGTKVRDLEQLCAGVARLWQLRKLHLQLTRTEVQNVAPLGKAVGQLQHLERLTLGLAGVKVEDMSCLCSALALPQVRNLRLDISHTEVRDLAPLCEGLRRLEKLQNLFLGLDGVEVWDVAPAVEAAVSLRELRDLKLWLGGTNLRELGPMCEGLEHMQQLCQLEVYLDGAEAPELQPLRKALEGRRLDFHLTAPDGRCWETLQAFVEDKGATPCRGGDAP